MKNISSEDAREHWSFLKVKNKIVLDMGCSFYEASFHQGMLSSAEWFVENGAKQVIGFDSDQLEVEKYNIVYKNNPKYNIFQLFLKNEEQIKDLLKFNPQVIKCDIEGAEINFKTITKEEMMSVEQIAFEYHDVITREMCKNKLEEWGFDFIEQYSLLDREPRNQGVYYGQKLSSIKKVKIPKILYIGKDYPKLVSTPFYLGEETSLDVKYETNDENIDNLLYRFNPDAIITIGDDDSKFTNLFNKPYDVRKKWMCLPENSIDLGNKAYGCAMNQILNLDNSKLISYFTPTYNTGVKLYDTYKSLVEQTYIDWEWVVVDDSTDEGKTLSVAKNIASIDSRVKVYSFEEKSGGIIGESKYRAAMLCRGYLLAELDHDDLLTNNCTLDLYNASQKYKDAGFFYTDSVEVNEYNQSLKYPEGFACGYGQYYKTNYKGYEWDVVLQPNINPKTIRHIVGVPNHVRAWRREVYTSLGGHNRDLSIADDYELIVRTFLHTKFCKISKLGYIQYLRFNGDGENTHNIARADIQRRVRTIADHYNEAINKRFKQLGKVDWIYESGIYDFIKVDSRYGNDEEYVNYIY